MTRYANEACSRRGEARLRQHLQDVVALLAGLSPPLDHLREQPRQLHTRPGQQPILWSQLHHLVLHHCRIPTLGMRRRGVHRGVMQQTCHHAGVTAQI